MTTNRSGWAVATVLLAVSLMTSGCGLGVDVSAPAHVGAGQPTQFQIKFTRFSACPLVNVFSSGPNVVFFPFVPQQDVDTSSFGLLCALDAGAGLGPDVFNLAQQAATAGSWAAASSSLHLTNQASSSISCNLGTCVDSSGEIDCSIDFSGLQNVGDMTTLLCTAAPETLGPTQNIALALVTATGVCAGVADNGKGCTADSDCLSNSCLSAMCSGGTNNGQGCQVSGDCPSGTCTPCLADAQFTAALGVGCAATSVDTAAPTLSSGRLVALAACLFAVAACYLGLHRRVPLR